MQYMGNKDYAKIEYLFIAPISKIEYSNYLF